MTSTMLLTVLLTFAVALLLAWPLILRTRLPVPVLFLFVLTASLSPIGFHYVLTGMLGYASSATSRLHQGEWHLLHHHADDRRKVNYVLVIHEGESEPRLYVIEENYEENKRGMARANTQVKQGVPMVGRPGEVGHSPLGDFEFYNFIEQQNVNEKDS